MDCLNVEIDEIYAFENASKSARANGFSWCQPYSIYFENGYWEVQAENYQIVRVNAKSGVIESSEEILDPVKAFKIAKLFALSSGLNWKPAFTLELSNDSWVVGSCRSQLGGQVSIYISHSEEILKHTVNPK